MNFENVTPAALPVGFAAMKDSADAENTRWYVGAVAGTATAAVVDTGIPASAWATSGQALKVTLSATTDSIFLQSDRFSDIQPGETLTFAANVTTSAGVDAVLPTITMFMGNFQSPSNYEGLVLKQGAVETGTEQVPANGEWRTIQATFTADTFGADLDGSGVNVYAAQGYQAAIAISGANLFDIAVPMDVFIDNIRIYKDAPITEKAFGATEIDVVQNALTTSLLDGEFEAASDLATSGWTVLAGASDGAAEIDVDASHLNNMFNHDGAKSLNIYFSTAASRGTTDLTEFVQADVRLNAETAGGANSNGDGIFAMTAWFKTDGADPKDAPGIMFGLADLNFKNTPFSDAGYAGAPLNGDWKKVTVQSVRLDASRLKAFVVVRAQSQTLLQTIAGTRWGAFTGVTSPGYESDANVYIDDVQFHKYQDSANYFDRSVFPVAD
jgi:hypothetical protein